MNIPKFTLLIDDTDIERFGIKLVNYETQSYLGRKSNGIDIPGAHGTQAVPSSYGSSDLIVNVVCSGKDTDEVQTRLRQFFAFMCSTQDAHSLVFTDDMQIVRYAILTTPNRHKVTSGIDGAMASVKLTFSMLDPFAYQRDVDVLATEAEHGAEILIENEAIECPAIFKIRNTSDSIITDLSLTVNDELASFSCELAPGDEIVLDTVEYEVKFNGNIRLDFWSGEMPMLRNGDNIIIQQNSQNKSLLLSVEFTRQWV